MNDPELDPVEEALIRAVVEDAVAPLDHLMAPELREWMRESLSDALATFPGSVQLLDQLRPRGPVERSGTVGKGKPKGEAGGER